MADERIAQIEVANIRPSPYQHRRVFDEPSLRELARSIETDGLIQAITVRPVNAHFELITGERRWRAVQQFTALATIDARVLQANDRQARRLCAVENLQRSDLTAIEEISALSDVVDADLLEFSDEYAPLAPVQEPKWRVRALLMKLAADKAHGTEYFVNNFVNKVEEIFSGLPKPKNWQAFFNHDLPLLFTADEVQQFALDHRLNKSQTKAIDALQKSAPEVFKEISQATPKQAAGLILGYSADDSVFADAAAGEQFEEVRDLSAETIRKATREIQAEQRRLQASPSLLEATDKPISIDLDALWIWGVLREFKATKIPRRPFAELVSLMTKTMREDVDRIAPQLSDYLSEK
jgi:hypothetical protein